MTEICKPTSENIKQAAEIIQNGGLVAMPTETVYGLGANVYNPQAVADIFAAKGRPAFNPLISHIAELDFLKTYAQTDERVMALAKKYWPGPLTSSCIGIDKKKRRPNCRPFCQQIPNHQPDYCPACL